MSVERSGSYTHVMQMFAAEKPQLRVLHAAFTRVNYFDEHVRSTCVLDTISVILETKFSCNVQHIYTNT